jgi:hypothetical protein
MIEHQKTKYNWIFVFLGAELESVNMAKTLGINANNVINYANNSKGYDAAYRSISSNITKLRSRTISGQSAATMDFFNQADYSKQDEVRDK